MCARFSPRQRSKPAQPLLVIARLDRAIQDTTAYRLISGVSGILDRPAFAGDDSRAQIHVLATDFVRGLLHLLLPPECRGRRECRVHAAPAVPCAIALEESAHEHTGEAVAVRHPLRNGVTAYFALSLGTGLSCPHHQQTLRTWPQRRETRTTRPRRPHRRCSSSSATRGHRVLSRVW